MRRLTLSQLCIAKGVIPMATMAYRVYTAANARAVADISRIPIPIYFGNQSYIYVKRTTHLKNSTFNYASIIYLRNFTSIKRII